MARKTVFIFSDYPAFHLTTVKKGKSVQLQARDAQRVPGS